MLVHCSVLGRATTHTKKWDRTCEEGGYCSDRKRTDTMVSQVQRRRVGSKSRLCFCKRFNIQAFIFTSEHVDGLPAKHMNFPAARTCVAICREVSAGVLMPCHWGPAQNKASRSEATRRFCPEFPPDYKTALLSLNSIFTYHLQLFQPAVLVLLLVTAVPNFRGNALVNFAWSRFWMSQNIPNLIVHLIFNSKCEDQNHTLKQRKKNILLSRLLLAFIFLLLYLFWSLWT